MERDPIDIINEELNLDLVRTIRGDEFKGVCPDQYDGGFHKLYLSRSTCELLARAFAAAAEQLTGEAP